MLQNIFKSKIFVIGLIVTLISITGLMIWLNTSNKTTPALQQNTQQETQVDQNTVDEYTVEAMTSSNLYDIADLSGSSKVLKIPYTEIKDKKFQDALQKPMFNDPNTNKKLDEKLFIVDSKNEVRFLGQSISDFFEFTVNNQIYWFFISQNTDSTSQLYFSKPDFFEVKQLSNPQKLFIVNTFQEEEDRTIFQLNTVKSFEEALDITVYTLDLKKVIADPKADPVTATLVSKPEEVSDDEIEEANAEEDSNTTQDQDLQNTEENEAESEGI